MSDMFILIIYPKIIEIQNFESQKWSEPAYI